MIYSERLTRKPDHKAFLLIFFLCLMLSGCSSWNIFGKKEQVIATPEKLYNLASDEYKEGHYKKAQEYFTRLKEEYPLHEMTILAEIGIADSFYSDKEYVDAADAYSNFISMHPLNEHVPYAIYQKGLCHYHQMDAIDRDQTETIKAKREWEKLISKYPDSKFSTEAAPKMKEVQQRLAEREFYVAKFYFHRKKYPAALARFEHLSREFPDFSDRKKVEYYIREARKKIAKGGTEKIKKEADQETTEKETMPETPSLHGSLYWMGNEENHLQTTGAD